MSVVVPEYLYIGFIRSSDATLIVMSELELRFSPSIDQDAGAFRLIELPPELCQLIDSTVETKTSQPM